MRTEYFSIVYNNFERNLLDSVKACQINDIFTDATLVCDDGQLKVHKIVISSCSDFFKNILTKNSHPHPLIYLNEVKIEVLKDIIHYVYYGEVKVKSESVNLFLKVAVDLHINGLVQQQTSQTQYELYKVESMKTERDGSHEKLLKEYKKTITNKISSGKEWNGLLESIKEKQAKENYFFNDEVSGENLDVKEQVFKKTRLDKDYLPNLDYKDNLKTSKIDDNEAKPQSENLSKPLLNVPLGELEVELNEEVAECNFGIVYNRENLPHQVIFKKVREITEKYTDAVLGENGEPTIKGTCKICNKTSNSHKAHLAEHMETHIKVSIYNCEYCGKSTNSYGTMRFHMRRICPQARDAENERRHLVRQSAQGSVAKFT